MRRWASIRLGSASSGAAPALPRRDGLHGQPRHPDPRGLRAERGLWPDELQCAGRTRFGTVGPAFPGVEIKIADDDEILVRGPNVFQGYYKDQGATDATLIDGWLHRVTSGASTRMDS